MKNSFLLILLVVFSVSCGKGSKTDDDKIYEKREMVEAEVAAVRSFCDAIQDKRYDFELRADGTLSYRVLVKNQSCSDTSYRELTYNITFRSPLGRSSYYWDAGTRNGVYFQDVVTDQSIPVSYLCEKYFAGDKVETVVEVGRTKYHYKPSANGGQSALVITTFSKDSNDDYVKRVLEGIVVDSRASSVTRGHVMDREMARSCGDGRDEHLRQTRY